MGSLRDSCNLRVNPEYRIKRAAWTPPVLLLLIMSVLNLSLGLGECALVSLNAPWTLSTPYKNIKIQNQTLPIGSYSAMENNGLSSAVYESFNDVNLRWISRRNWTFATQFKTPPEIKDQSHAVLTFLGVDTVATIVLNDKILGMTDNMFVRYRFDVKNALMDASGEKSNTLVVELQNPIKVAGDLAANSNFTPPECPPGVYNGECHVNFLRKMQASFAWDWGLAAPSVGLWKDVQLEMYNGAKIRDVSVVMDNKDRSWQVKFIVHLEAGRAAAQVAGNLEIIIPELNNTRASASINQQSNAEGELSHPLTIMIPENMVKLWWPNGFGAQQLYAVNVSFVPHDSVSHADPEKDTKILRIGFRTIKLIQRDLGTGLSFFFEVNGHPIFMKGSNWIPADVLPERGADRPRIKRLLTAAKDAHMNMLRVWGGGVYESDYFYDLADEYGILIWQDLMFACAMYPVHEAFLDSVRVEVVQNVRRLQHHPSVAIYATNNENEVALVQNWYKTHSEDGRFRADYRKLYIDVIKRAVEETDEWRICLSSSPSNGLQTANDSWISANPQDNHYGDIHYYNYMNDGWNWNIYPNPRFVSEYGFQSYPALSSWAQTLGGDDYLPDLLKHRQHSPLGELPILLLIGKHLPLSRVPKEQALEAKIYFSQISQAMAIKAETELYRTLRGTSANTMGALYWQLNDVWVAPSWSSIDFLGNYKILHHFAKKFLEPVSVVPILSASNVLQLNVVNDLLELPPDERHYEVVLKLFSWGSLKSSVLQSWRFEMTPNSAMQVEHVSLWDIFNSTLRVEENFLQVVLVDGNEQVVSSNFLFPVPIKGARGVQSGYVPDVSISSSACVSNQQTTVLTIRASAPVLFFYIDILNESIRDYQLSDNGFVIVEPTTRITVTYPNVGCVGNQLGLGDFKVYTVNQYL